MLALQMRFWMYWLRGASLRGQFNSWTVLGGGRLPSKWLMPTVAKHQLPRPRPPDTWRQGSGRTQHRLVCVRGRAVRHSRLQRGVKV